MNGSQLRERIHQLGLSYDEAAPALGISLSGLQKQISGVRAVSRQTELLLNVLEDRNQWLARFLDHAEAYRR